MDKKVVKIGSHISVMTINVNITFVETECNTGNKNCSIKKDVNHY